MDALSGTKTFSFSNFNCLKSTGIATPMQLQAIPVIDLISFTCTVHMSYGTRLTLPVSGNRMRMFLRFRLTSHGLPI